MIFITNTEALKFEAALMSESPGLLLNGSILTKFLTVRPYSHLGMVFIHGAPSISTHDYIFCGKLSLLGRQQQHTSRSKDWFCPIPFNLSADPATTSGLGLFTTSPDSSEIRTFAECLVSLYGLPSQYSLTEFIGKLQKSKLIHDRGPEPGDVEADAFWFSLGALGNTSFTLCRCNEKGVTRRVITANLICS